MNFGSDHPPYDIRKVGGGGGGGGSPLQVRYTKSGKGGGGGGQFASGTIRKVEGGGGGGGQFASGPIRKVERGGADTFVWHKENTLSLIINGYSFDQGGCSSTSHARANELKCCF